MREDRHLRMTIPIFWYDDVRLSHLVNAHHT